MRLDPTEAIVASSCCQVFDVGERATRAAPGVDSPALLKHLHVEASVSQSTAHRYVPNRAARCFGAARTVQEAQVLVQNEVAVLHGGIIFRYQAFVFAVPLTESIELLL